MTPDLPAQFSPNTTFLLVGPILFWLQAIVLWMNLRPKEDRTTVNLWVCGSVLAGAGIFLVVMRGWVPDLASYTGGNVLVVGSLLLRGLALQYLLQEAPRRGHVVALWAALGLYGVVFQVLYTSYSTYLRLSFALTGWSLAAAYLATWGWRVWRRQRSNTAALMFWVEASHALVLAFYVLALVTGQLQPVVLKPSWQLLVLGWAIGISAIYGNLAYLGLLMEKLQLQRQAAREGEQRQHILRELAEKDAAELRAALQQRDLLSAERETLLRVLTHEIRQPLHNAGGALQSIRLSTRDGPGLSADQLRERVLRAEQVLGRMRDVLDNVLSAALLLQQTAPPRLQDTELDTLLEMTLLDLSESERARVQLDWRSALNNLPVEPNLLRLAVRNLLRNALLHGGPQAQVRLCVEDGFSPQRLRITVLDDGPGMLPLALQAHNLAGGQASAGMADAAISLAVRPNGGGLGLQIVRRVAALHGGSLQLHNLAQRGLAVVLELPAPDDWDGAESAALSQDAAASRPSFGAAGSPPSMAAPSP